MSQTMQQVEFLRDCEVVQIPAGHPVTVEKGTEAFVTQSLGGSYTLQVPTYGLLVRLAGKDSDAIGLEPPSQPAAENAAVGDDLEKMVWETLRTCYDPEIPVNIVDLGLVYDMHMDSLASGAKKVNVKMTLTAQGCGMGTFLASDAEQKLAGLPGVEEARVEIVWDPPWNPQMISPEGREKLGIA
jgi:probable FeS assembly SUF system protein SufT